MRAGTLPARLTCLTSADLCGPGEDKRAQVNYKTQHKVSVEGFGYRGDGDTEMCEEETPEREQNSSEFIAQRFP